MQRAIVASVLAIAAPAHATVIEISSIHFGQADGTKLDLIDDFSTGNIFTEMAPVQPATSIAATTVAGGLAELGGLRLVGTYSVPNATNLFTGADVDQSVEVDNGTFRVTSRNNADIFRAAVSWQPTPTDSGVGNNNTQVGVLNRTGYNQSVDFTRGGLAEGFIVTVESADVAFTIRNGFAIEFGDFLPITGSGSETLIGPVSSGSPLEVFLPFTSDGSVPMDYSNVGFHQGIEIFAVVPAPSSIGAFACAGLIATRRRR